MNSTKLAVLVAIAGMFVAAGPSATRAFAIDDVVENSETGHWYKLVTSLEALDWSTCETDAQKMGGYLATVSSAEENQWLSDKLLAGASETYLGGSDAASEGTWVWSNGEKWNYSNWAKGQPDDAKGYANSLVTGGAWGSGWDDQEGVSSGSELVYGYVVEWDFDPNGATVVPDAPANLTANFADGVGVSLSWTDTSGGASAETGFLIERRPAGFVFAELTRTAADATSHVDQFLYPSTTFIYRVRAFNASGESPWSNEASATTSASVPIPALPRAPTQLAATPVQGGTNEISWTDNSRDEVRFALERATGGDDFRSLSNVDSNVAAYSDDGVRPGWPCTYRVRALALQGPSPYSNPATAVQPATIDVATTSGSLADSPKPRKDKLKLSAALASAAPLDPVAAGLELQLGPANAPVLVSIAPADSGWKVKTKKGVPAVAAWKSSKGVAPSVTIVFDLAKQVLTVTVSGADFGAAPTSLVRVLVASGADGGAHAATWTQKKPGQFVFD